MLGGKGWGLTVLNAIRTPLIHADLAEDSRTLVKQFVHDAILGRPIKILKSMLNNEGTCFMACEGSPFAFERLVDTEDEYN